MMASPGKRQLSFADHVAALHAPSIALAASRDCDVVVRTASTFPSLMALLNAHLPRIPPALASSNSSTSLSSFSSSSTVATTSTSSTATTKPTISSLPLPSITSFTTTPTAAKSTHPVPPALRLVPEPRPTPPLWARATRALNDSLAIPQAVSSPSKLVAAFAAALEDVTFVAEHTHLADPLLHIAAAWVGEDGPPPVPSYRSASTSSSNRGAHHEDDYDDDVDPSDPSAPPPRRPVFHVLLVVRAENRQDEHALSNARQRAIAVHGSKRVHVLRLPSQQQPPSSPVSSAQSNVSSLTSSSPDSESPSAIAALLRRLTADTLSNAAEAAAAAAAAARRAARPSFRSWFSSTATQPSSLRAPISSSPLTSTSSTTSSSSAGRHTSFGAAARPPLFDYSSVEALTRRAADLQFRARRYADAADSYRSLVGDTRLLSGPAVVHEAAALEGAALCLACLPGPPAPIATAMERALTAYHRAGRPELATRLALRAARFCNEAGFPDSAAAFILRALTLLGPTGMAPASSGSAFVDVALAVLSAANSAVASAVGKRRRASLYAFLSMTRFASHRHMPAAACMARQVDEAALARPAVRHEIDLVLAAAAAADDRPAAAVSHFVAVLSATSERTDVELQGEAARGFLASVAAGGGGLDKRRRWDQGHIFPIVPAELASVSTSDSAPEQPLWRALEDDVLEDHSYFKAVRSATDMKPVPKRERRVEAVVADLRRKRDRRDGRDPGGSLEMKIRRMREMAVARRRRLREASLLERGAVVGERVKLKVTFRNPLQFPVFLANLSPVVTLDGKLYSWNDVKVKHSGLEENGIQESNGDAKHNESREERRGDENNLSNGHEKDETGEEVPPVELFPIEEVALLPSALHEVEMIVTTRCAGILQFIGLEWEFTIGMGSTSPKTAVRVPGFTVLQKRGQRLNETRRQRASDVPLYEEDRSLTVRVVAAAPRLRAHMQCRVDDDSFTANLNNVILRAGERRDARIILENDGSVPVKDVVLRVGTPQTLFVDTEPTESSHDGTPCALAADEDVARQREATVATQTTVNLGLRERRELSVWVRAAVPSALFAVGATARMRRGSAGGGGIRGAGGSGLRGGEHFAECEDGSVRCFGRLVIAYGNDKVRVCRLDVQFVVRPSILVSPRFMRGADPSNLTSGRNRATQEQTAPWLSGVLLGVEVEHGGRDAQESGKFEVTEVSVTSRSGWQPMFLPEAENPDDGGDDGELVPSESCLRINETATIFILIVRDEHAVENESLDYDIQSDGITDKGTIRSATSGNTARAYAEKDRGTRGHGETKAVLWRTVRARLADRSTHCNSECTGESAASTHFVVAANGGGSNAIGASGGEERDTVCVAVGWRSGASARGQVHIASIDPVRWLRQSDRGVTSERTPSATPPASVTSSPRVSVCGSPAVGLGANGGVSNIEEARREIAVRVKVSHAGELEHDFLRSSSSGTDGGVVATTAGSTTSTPTSTSMSTSVSAAGVAAAVHPALTPVEIRVRNEGAMMIDVMFSARPVGGVADGDRTRFWAGDIGTALRALPPGGERILRLTAVLAAPGRFDVARFSVTAVATGPNGERVRRSVRVQPSYLTVRDRSAAPALVLPVSKFKAAAVDLVEKPVQAEDEKLTK